MTTVIKAIDPYVLNLIEPATDFIDAIYQHDGVTAAEAALEEGEGITNGFYYATWLATYVGATLKNLGLLNFLYGFEIIGAGIVFVKETFSFLRQVNFHSIFRNRVWTPDTLVQALQDVDSYKDSSLKRVMPEWLYKEVEDRGKGYLGNIIEKIKNGDVEATNRGAELLEQMRSYSVKKQIMHFIGIVGAVIGIIGFIVAHFACPHLVILTLMCVGLCFTGAQYLFKKGVVENPDGCFSITKCTPEFFQEWLKKKPEIKLPPPIDPLLCRPIYLMMQERHSYHRP